MAARFDVALTAGERDGDTALFEPGQEVTGRVTIDVDREVECRGLDVRLIWHTEGRGDEDKGVVGETDIFQGRLTPGVPVSADFTFRLPVEPWSYAGTYLSIVWAIEIIGDVPMSRDLTHRHPFVMRPRQTR